jgi:hypothetical protein
LEIEAKPSGSPTPAIWEGSEFISEIETQVEDFATEYSAQVDRWSEKFDVYRRQGKRVVLWAAGMRAISFLVNVPLASAGVDSVVDVNPQRQGRYLPKTGQAVIAPQKLPAIRPDVVVATNPNYAREISAQLDALGIRCQFEVLR